MTNYYLLHWVVFRIIAKTLWTRMHSSRMRTVCFGSRPWFGGWDGVHPHHTHPLPKFMLWCMPYPAQVHAGIHNPCPTAWCDTPPPRGQSDTCENINFPQLRLRVVIKVLRVLQTSLPLAKVKVGDCHTVQKTVWEYYRPETLQQKNHPECFICPRKFRIPFQSFTENEN